MNIDQVLARNDVYIDDNNYWEPHNLTPNYIVGGLDTGLPIGKIHPSAADVEKSSKYFNFYQWKDEPNSELTCFLSKERCIHRNKQGRQCARQTVMGVQRCWQHLKLHWKLRIKDTGTRMGLGLFAAGKTDNPEEVVFNAGELITDYLGNLINNENLARIYGRETAPYASAVGFGWNIDSACRRGVGAFVNHKPTRQRPNAYWSKVFVNLPGNPWIPRTVIKARRRIYNGEQIFVSYGNSYRMARNYSAYSTVNLKNTPARRNATGLAIL